MSEFKFSCAHCQQHMQCQEQLAGREIQCQVASVSVTMLVDL